MENRFKLVMLPTNEASNLYTEKGVLRNSFFTKVRNWIVDGSNQHLYIVDTKATLEVGDWYYNKRLNVLKQYLVGTTNPNKDVCYKIIVSTNSSLGLPTIPNHFLKAYCLDQNTIIKNVEIVDDKANVNWVVDSPEKTEIILDDIFPDEELDYSDKKEKSFEEQALEWWDNLENTDHLTDKDKGFYADKYFGFNQRNYKSLTGREIEQIWLKETGQNQKPRVDFEELQKFINFVNNDMVKTLPVLHKDIDNFKLFFECIKNPSFAHKASKWFKENT